MFAYSEAPLDGRCERMMVKMGVKGIKIETLSKLVNAGLITKLADCFRLDENQVASVPGLGLSSAEILCAALEKKLQGELWDWEILSSVGILNVGRTPTAHAQNHHTSAGGILGTVHIESLAGLGAQMPLLGSLCHAGRQFARGSEGAVVALCHQHHQYLVVALACSQEVVMGKRENHDNVCPFLTL